MKIIKSPLFQGSLILLITMNIYNILNFTFQIAMARMLTVADYGALVTLLSVTYLIGIFTESIQTILAKYSTGEKENGLLKNIFVKTTRKSMFLSTSIFLIFIIIALPLSYILNISYFLVASSGLIIFISPEVP